MQYLISDFNTSYVAVQPSWIWWASTKNRISTHLMLRFNLNHSLSVNKMPKFQYILCCGSTIIVLMNWLVLINFNTSYVAVQRSPKVMHASRKEYFNTSYVAVQLPITCQKFIKNKISIHLMLRFNTGFLK